MKKEEKNWNEKKDPATKEKTKKDQSAQNKNGLTNNSKFNDGTSKNISNENEEEEIEETEETEETNQSDKVTNKDQSADDDTIQGEDSDDIVNKKD